MKKGINLTVIFLSLVMIFASIAPNIFAALPTVTQSFNSDAAQEINQALHSNTVTNLGTRLIGPLKKETSLFTGTGTADEIDIDEADSVVRFVTVAGGGISEAALGNSQPGALMTFVLVTDGGHTVDVTPTTKTGFTSITMQDAKDSCTLRYQDDTIGWVVAGNAGCTIN